MGDRIVYNRDTMNALAGACRNASADLEEAQRLLNEIRSHQDWTCVEKDQLDELMRTAKKLIDSLANDQESFLSKVEKWATKLVEGEHSIPEMLQPLESLIAKLLSKRPSSVESRGGGLLGDLGRAAMEGAEALEESTKPQSGLNFWGDWEIGTSIEDICEDIWNGWQDVWNPSNNPWGKVTIPNISAGDVGVKISQLPPSIIIGFPDTTIKDDWGGNDVLKDIWETAGSVIPPLDTTIRIFNDSQIPIVDFKDFSSTLLQE